MTRLVKEMSTIEPMNSDSSSTAEKLEFNRVSNKIPPSWSDRLEIWFYRWGIQFKICEITKAITKFNYLVVQLEPKYVENIWE